uniref:Uncharacterized protein n=1 Tax=Meloidogyne floridensis TaxID=298350 RepID=A0A915P2H9_9BILA
MKVFILIILFVSYVKSAYKVSSYSKELVLSSPKIAPLHEANIPKRTDVFAATSSESSSKQKGPPIAEKEYSINDLIVEFEVHVGVQHACMESTKFLLDLFGNKHNKDKENANKENKLKLKNRVLLKLFEASEAGVEELKELINNFEEELYGTGLFKKLEDGLKYKRDYYKNRGKKLKEADVFNYLPEQSFLDSLPGLLRVDLMDEDWIGSRKILFKNFLKTKRNEEKEEEEKKEGLAEEENQPKNQPLKNFLKIKMNEEAEEHVEEENQPKTGNKWKKAVSYALKNKASPKNYLRNVINTLIKLRDVCIIFNEKDVDNLLMIKKDSFYYNIEERKNLRKLNSLDI